MAFLIRIFSPITYKIIIENNNQYIQTDISSTTTMVTHSTTYEFDVK
jgi:hypothetical protein